MIPQWFIYLQGFAMLIMGISLLAMRPRHKGDSFYTRFVNLGTLWALLCCVVGVALLAMALGYWRWPPGGGSEAPRTGSPAQRVRHR